MNRRKFVLSAAGVVGATMLSRVAYTYASDLKRKGRRVGIVGLDTSHAVALTKLMNSSKIRTAYNGYVVTVAYPYGNPDLANHAARIAKYTEEIKTYDVKVVDSLDQLLDEVDVVLLLTNDGNRHLEQALQIIRAKKPLFIDKPIANSRQEASTIYENALNADVPVFSSSSLRFIPSIQQLDTEGMIGADVYTPALREPSHKGLYWYGIHGVEMLFALMGRDCISVTTYSQLDGDMVVGLWKDGRVGTLRALQSDKQGFGGRAFFKGRVEEIGGFDGYENLLAQIVKFFDTHQSPLDYRDTLQICAFIDAAYESRLQGGASVLLAQDE